MISANKLLCIIVKKKKIMTKTTDKVVQGFSKSYESLKLIHNSFYRGKERTQAGKESRKEWGDGGRVKASKKSRENN